MHLKPYLRESRTTQAEFGRMVSPPVTQQQVFKWLDGSTRITLDYALQINHLTGGIVTPQDCHEMFVNVKEVV